jgi:hypothetical protein
MKFLLFFLLSWVSVEAQDGDDELGMEIDRTLVDLQNPAATPSQNFSFSSAESRKEIVTLLQSRPFRSIPHADVKKLIETKFANTSTGQFFEKSPAALDLLVNVVKDDHALPEFSKIILQEKKVMYFGISFIVMTLVLAYIKRKIPNPFHQSLYQFIFWMVKTALFIPITLFCSFALMMAFFPTELGPLYKLIVPALPQIIKEL